MLIKKVNKTILEASVSLDLRHLHTNKYTPLLITNTFGWYYSNICRKVFQLWTRDIVDIVTSPSLSIALLQRDQYESELDSIREENKNVSQKLQQANHTNQELEQSVHKYELELTVSQQKNKTCQQEVRFTNTIVEGKILRATLLLWMSYVFSLNSLHLTQFIDWNQWAHICCTYHM